jgi:DNA polymerase-3 subunit epsilon
MTRARARRSAAALEYRHSVIDLDQPWRATSYCVVDLETTGLDLRRDEIVSYGAVPIDDGRIVAGSTRSSLVANAHRLRPTSIVVHGLRPVDLADAPSWEDVVDDLLLALTGRVLVAHAAWVETAFLGRGLRTRRVRAPRYVVDTAALARAAGLASPAGPAEPSLEGLARRLGLPPHAPHDALGDALTTAEVFLALTARLPGEGSLTARDLVQVSERHRLVGRRARSAGGS